MFLEDNVNIFFCYCIIRCMAVVFIVTNHYKVLGNMDIGFYILGFICSCYFLYPFIYHNVLVVIIPVTLKGVSVFVFKIYYFSFFSCLLGFLC